jgi:DDE superfamily endonuclease
MNRWTLPRDVQQAVRSLTATLHVASAARLLPLLTGVLFARGRRTVTSWLRAAGLGNEFQPYYYFLARLGRHVPFVAAALLRLLVQRLVPGDRWLFALDDTPTKRAGPKVEGAGIHHNPTPGPAGQHFLYGHVWVTLAWVIRHPRWGTIGLPLLAFLYIRQKDVAKLRRKHGWRFRTKLELATALLCWLAIWLRRGDTPVWVVADGFYAKAPLLQAARQQEMVVVSRLRKDACLWSVPPVVPPEKRKRGQPRKYGCQRLSLAKRAGHRQGWQTTRVYLYGKWMTKTYKTFRATYRPARGTIRIVLVREDDGSWVAFGCTDSEATVAAILEAVADRSAIEQDFKDVKEVEGAGQQQVRNLWANIGAWNICLWAYTLVEWWAWGQPKKALCDRSASPWDTPARRPSHADRRKALQRQSIAGEFSVRRLAEQVAPRIRRMLSRLVQMVV